MLPCLVCGTVLEPVGPDNEGGFPEDQPDRGLIFRARGDVDTGGGNSAVFQPMAGTPWLEIVVCDGCLKAGSAKRAIELHH